MSEDFRRLIDELKSGIVDLQDGVPQVMQASGRLAAPPIRTARCRSRPRRC